MKELIRNLLFSVCLLISGIVLGYLYPVSKLYADRGGKRNVSAIVERSLFGLITLEEQKISRLHSASVETNRNGGMELILSTKEGPVVFGKDARLGGEREANKINAFLEDYRAVSFFIWDVSWPWFVLSCFLALAGLAIGILSLWQAAQTALF